jgi:hypothetical protein
MRIKPKYSLRYSVAEAGDPHYLIKVYRDSNTLAASFGARTDLDKEKESNYIAKCLKYLGIDKIAYIESDEDPIPSKKRPTVKTINAALKTCTQYSITI